MEQRVETLHLGEPFVSLRVPKLFNLRTDPFERADVTSNTYYDWMLDNAYLILAGTTVAAQFLETFKEFPPRRGGELHDRPGGQEARDGARVRSLSVVSRLASWNDGPTKDAVLAFVERVTADGVPPAERVAVFDNDGTLWCEKPLPIQADFIPSALRWRRPTRPSPKQPWKAAHERDYAWLGRVMEEHYKGDDTNVRTLLGGVIAAHAGSASTSSSSRRTRSCTRRSIRRSAATTSSAVTRRWSSCCATWLSGFSNYIASGGGRDFMRPISEEMYGIQRDRVIGARSRSTTRPVTTAARSCASRRPMSSTTACRSRSGSGVASAAVRSSPPATRTRTSRCSTSPSTQTSRRAPARPPRRRRARVRLYRRAPRRARAGADGGVDGGRHRERLGDRVRVTASADGMVWVERATFRIGSDSHYPEEAPAHRVAVEGFWIDRCQVTNSQFAAFVEQTGYVTVAERPSIRARFRTRRRRTSCRARSSSREPRGRSTSAT